MLLAACGGGGKRTLARGTVTTLEETSTTAAGGSTTIPAVGGAPGATTKTTAKGNTPANNKVNGQAQSNYTPPPGATPAKPATPGTYTYDNQGTSTFGAPPAKSPLTVDPPAGTRQHSTNDTGSSGKTETTLDYQSDGVHLVEIKITNGSTTFDFVGNPPPLAAPTGVKPGQSVDFDLSTNPPGTNIHVHIDFVRMETITIGGQPVDTMVIHQVGTLSGNLTGTQTMDAWVAPQQDLFVKSHQIADVKYGAFNIHSDVTSTLEKLTPG
jgi:hypothetical protein